MSRLTQFGKFWYDFIIGDDWRIAVGVVATLTGVYFVAHHGTNVWWLLPVAVAALLTFSVVLEMRRKLR